MRLRAGVSVRDDGASPLIRLEDGTEDGAQHGSVYGCYLHGFFDHEEARTAVLNALAERKGVTLGSPAFDWRAYKERQYDLLADTLRASLDMDLIRRIIDRKA